MRLYCVAYKWSHFDRISGFLFVVANSYGEAEQEAKRWFWDEHDRPGTADRIVSIEEKESPVTISEELRHA